MEKECKAEAIAAVAAAIAGPFPAQEEIVKHILINDVCHTTLIALCRKSVVTDSVDIGSACPPVAPMPSRASSSQARDP
jgi:hypothetical protein